MAKSETREKSNPKKVQGAKTGNSKHLRLLDNVLLFFSIFAAISIILSLWLGYFWRSSIFIVVVSAVLAFILSKKFHLALNIPRSIYLLAILMFVLSAYPSFLITPFYNGSLDTAQIINVRVIGETIPATYAPYSDITIGYYLGYHTFVKLFADLLPIMPDYLWYWLLGALFSAIELLFIFLFVREFFKNENAGLWAAVLFLGTKAVFLNMYWGMHPMILGMAFLLFAAYLYRLKNRLTYLFFPLTFILHAGAAFNAFIFFLAMLLSHREKLRTYFHYLLSLLLALPSFLTTYYIYLLGVSQRAAETTASSFSLKSLASALFYIPTWIGFIPFIAFLLALFYMHRRKVLAPQLYMLLSLFLMYLIFFAIFSSTPFLAGTQSKVMSMLAFVAIAFSAGVFSTLKFSRNKAFIAAVLALCLFTFFSSGMLNELRSGNTITPAQADFAIDFYAYDSSLQKTFFLTENAFKIAELSNKIPYDVLSGYPPQVYLAYGEWQVLKNKAYKEMQSKHEQWLSIKELKDLEAISALGVKYLVIDSSFFTELPEGEPMVQKGTMRLYKLQP